MNSLRSFVLLTVVTFLSAPVGMAQEKVTEQLGKVTFPTSCDPKVQAQFERGVAMLHSYWFTEAGKVFDAVAKQDPNCVMAYWGYAVNLLGNSLANPPSAKDAQAAWEALERARAIGAKTERERDWIEALSAYYRDHDKVSVDDRLLAYTKAMEQMTQRYPDDFEAWALLRADTPGIRAEDRQDLRQPAKIRSHSGKALQTEPAASGSIALSDPCLRLSAACR